MPVLFQHIGDKSGRFLAIAFFLCLTLAGLSSLISLLELSIHTLTDFGGGCHSLYLGHCLNLPYPSSVVHRIPATILIGVSSFLLGCASAVDLSILVNQDAVWG